MRKLIVAIAAALVAFATSASAAPAVPAQDGYVTDTLHLFNEQQETDLEARLHAFQEQLPGNPQIAVLTTRDVGGSPSAYASDVGNTWHMGQAGLNNGIVILLYPGSGRYHVFMAPAGGLSHVLSAGKVGEMLDETMVPRLRGDGSALYQGLTELIASTHEVIETAGQEAVVGTRTEPQSAPPGTMFAVLGGFLATLFFGYRGVLSGMLIGAASGVISAFVIAGGAPGIIAILMGALIGGFIGLIIAGFWAGVRDGAFDGPLSGGGYSYGSGSSSSSDDSWGGGSGGGSGGWSGSIGGGGGGFGGGGAGR